MTQQTWLVAVLILLAVAMTGIAAVTFDSIDVPNAVDTEALGINEHQQIVGVYSDPGGTAFHGFLLDQGNLTTIDVPDAALHCDAGRVCGTGAYGINDRAQIIGFFVTFESDIFGEHGFLFDHGTYTTFDMPGASETLPFAVNTGGQIVGSYFPGSGDLHDVSGFLLDNGTFTTIDVPGAILTFPSGINDRGQIVVVSSNRHNFDNRSFLLDHGSFTSINVPGSIQTSANGINNRGQIVGAYFDGKFQQHGFMLERGGFTTIDVPGSTLTQALGINDAGKIVGQYRNSTGLHGFVIR